MHYKFQTLGTGQEIDLVPYLKNFLEEYPESTVLVGCDSQNKGDYTNYAIVIALHQPSLGGHVIFTKVKVSRIRDRFTKLWNEIEYSLEVAEHLKASGVDRIDYIDIDLNPDPRYGSNNVLRAALGYLQSYGYKTRCKPHALAATYVADALCK